MLQETEYIGDAEWRGRKFTLIDTAGLEPKSEDKILISMREQVQIAIDIADVIVFMTDMKQGITEQDKDVAMFLRKTKKPIVLVCNKADKFGKENNDIYEFYNLGIGEPHAISSVNASGIGDVLDEIYKHFNEEDETDEDEGIIKVALIRKTKCTENLHWLIKYFGENRVIVSDVAGTTRDAIDTFYENEEGKYIFIDTAGLRRKNKIKEDIEKYSIIRTMLAIERADICLLMIDAKERCYRTRHQNCRRSTRSRKGNNNSCKQMGRNRKR